MASKDQINSQYITEKVNPLLEKLVIDLLIHKPENSVFSFGISSIKPQYFSYSLVRIHENLAVRKRR